MRPAMRPLTRALSVLLAATLVLGAALSGPAALGVQELLEAPSCEDAFAVAEGLVTATDAVRTGADGDLDAPSDAARAALAQALIDLTIRSCDGAAEWLVTAAGHVGILGGDNPVTYLRERCADPAAGLADAPACADIASPSPSPSTEPRTVKLPTIKPKVKGARRTRYYPIEGQSPDELFTQMQVKGAEHCPTHAVACALIQPTIRPLVTTGSSCRVVGVKASLDTTAWIPVWTDPKRVYPELVDWWRTVSTRVARHEAEHVRIAQRYLAKLKKEIIGKSCASLNAYAARWSKEVTAAQDAWDRKEFDRPWPEYTGPLPPGFG